MICWHNKTKFEDRCRLDHRDDLAFTYGRCRSGRRCFWAVTALDESFTTLHGWQENYPAALEAVVEAVTQLAEGLNAYAWSNDGHAAGRLKEINAAKRAARPPPDGTDSKPVEYLYGYRRGPVRFKIIKKTRKRIYYLKNGAEQIDASGEPIPIEHTGIRHLDDLETRVGVVDRERLEKSTDAVYGSGHRYTGDWWELFASLPKLLAVWEQIAPEKPQDIRQLKAAMAAAHPDHGGNSAQFIAARQAYINARRHLKQATVATGKEQGTAT